MRDNHTFRKLPRDIEQAMLVLREEWAAGYTCGMLCAEHGAYVHAHGKDTWDEFEGQARTWLAQVQEWSPTRKSSSL